MGIGSVYQNFPGSFGQPKQTNMCPRAMSRECHVSTMLGKLFLHKGERRLDVGNLFGSLSVWIYPVRGNGHGPALLQKRQGAQTIHPRQTRPPRSAVYKTDQTTRGG
eukprot:scaffold4929_cov176-Amphora_coffeaeformis.AAC.4